MRTTKVQTKTSKQKISKTKAFSLKNSEAKKTTGKKATAQNHTTPTTIQRKSSSTKFLLDKGLLLAIHDHMVQSRVLEERLIKIYKAGDAYFWIGGPGEEAWGVPLGMLANKGQGPEYDYLHLHYRCTPTLVAMGMPMIDSIRLIMNKVTDRSTGGRNFSNHYCYPEWNVAPVTSPIEVQYLIATGTAHIQKKMKTKGVTIVSGGDAGTAEGDFASCLVWASRKGQELPMLITVQNNLWGISTAYEGQHGETHIADRAKGFNIRSRVINGNDPEESYLSIQEELNYIRKTGQPSFIEARVSRLYGHSSASGANLASHEIDPLKDFEEKLLKAGLLKETEVKQLWTKYSDLGFEAQQQVRTEMGPEAASIWDHIYAGNENADWRKF